MSGMNRSTMASCAVPGLVLAIVLAAECFADVAILPPAPKYGQSPVPAAAPTSVAMVEETVLMDVHPRKTLVDAVFILENRGDQAEHRVGFPYYGGIRDFRAFVDGAEISVMSEEIKRNELSEGPIKSSPYGTWIIWNMTFAKGAKTTVRVTYCFVNGGYEFDSVPTADGEATITVCWNNPEEGKLEEKLIEEETAYVLKTGATWLGKIGKAVVEARLHDIRFENLRALSPRGPAKVQGDRITWTFIDFEPGEDILMRFNKAMTLDEEIAIFEKISRPEVSRRNLEYYWRPRRLIELYKMKGGAEARIEALYRESIDRYWPKDPLKAPLEMGEIQIGALISALESFHGFLHEGKKRKEAGILADRALPLLNLISGGGAFTVYPNGYRHEYEKNDRLPKRAAALSESMKEFLKALRKDGGKAE